MNRKAPGPASTRDDGVGTIGTAAAFTVFLLLMFVAVQVLFNLYATSMVTSAAHDAASQVAGFDAFGDRCKAAAEAEFAFEQRLGRYGEAGHAELEWTCADPDIVRVRVRARHPTLLPASLAGLASLSEVDRTIEVRVEGP